MNTHVFDYHGVKVRVKIIQGVICVDPKDTLKCLGFDDANSSPEEMFAKLVSMKGTRTGLAFAHWMHTVLIPSME